MQKCLFYALSTQHCIVTWSYYFLFMYHGSFRLYKCITTSASLFDLPVSPWQSLSNLFCGFCFWGKSGHSYCRGYWCGHVEAVGNDIPFTQKAVPSNHWLTCTNAGHPAPPTFRPAWRKSDINCFLLARWFKGPIKINSQSVSINDCERALLEAMRNLYLLY